MNIGDVMDEIAAAVKTVPDLQRVFAYRPDSVDPPCVIVDYPLNIDYQGAYSRGMDMLTFPVMVIVSLVHDRTAKDLLTKYLDGSGTHSLKAAIDGYEYTAADSVTVTNAEPSAETYAAIDYLAYTLDVVAVGTGSTD